MKQYKLYLGDNMASLKKLPDNSIDSVVTDPPYALTPSKGAKAGFMGKLWDAEVPSVEFWKEVYRVLKPGGHILSFGGTRTYHRMVVNIEDAGFEIRDQIMWIYGSGFPKSLNIGKAVDKIQGNKREVVGEADGCGKSNNHIGGSFEKGGDRKIDITKGNSQFEGYGTALKPANEPICVARKPLSEKTVAANMMKWGTGGINVDGCRIGNDMISSGKTKVVNGGQLNGENTRVNIEETFSEGRFPANIIFECTCDEVIKGKEIKGNENYNFNNVELKETNTFKGRGKYTPRTETPDIHTDPNCPCYQLDQQSGVSKSNCKSGIVEGKNAAMMDKYDDSRKNGSGMKNKIMVDDYSDKGGASRFFYVAKVSKKERNMGLDGFEEKQTKGSIGLHNVGGSPTKDNDRINKNHHPTVKPINLMTYLIRLVTPENGIVLEPFMGSGSTGVAAMLEGKRFVGMEQDESYFKIAEKRIESWEQYKKIQK